MAKPVKLKIPIQYDFLLIGIVSSEPIYRLAWLLNEQLGINLAESNKLRLYDSKKESLQDFEYFIDSESAEDTFELIHNKGVHGLLLEEQPKVDFFIKVSQSSVIVGDLLSKIKTIKGVTMTFEIVPDSLKSINRLLFDVIED